MNFKFYNETNFKQTDLGPLPQEWEVVKLGEVAIISSGGSAPQGDFYFGGKNYFIRVSHIDIQTNTIKTFDLITDDAVKKYKLKLFPKGTIVFPKSGATIYLEKRAQLPFDSYIVSHLCAVQSSFNNLDQKFLYYVLLKTKFAEKKGDGYPTLNLSEIKEIPIPLPPLSEQKAIAEILQTIQEAREKTEAVIEATRQLKKSMIKHLFTYGVANFDFRFAKENNSIKNFNSKISNRKSQIKLKDTEIGPIPEHWQVVRFKELLNQKSEYSVTKVKKENYLQFGKIPIIDQSQNYISGYWNNEEDAFVGELPVIIFGDHTRVFKYVDFKFVCGTDGTKIIIPKKSMVSPLFFYYALTFKEIPSRGYNRHYSILKNLPIPLPPLPEQQAIAEILQAIDEKIEKEVAKKKALENLFKSMLNNLMSGKLRVKIMEGKV